MKTLSILVLTLLLGATSFLSDICVRLSLAHSTQVSKSLASTNFATPANADLYPWRTSCAKKPHN